MRVAVYSRVSSEKQEKEGTIQSQLAELREACKEYQIVEEYIDNGYSGELLERPALDKLRDDAKEGKFEAVYILEPDRLSRDLVNGVIVKRELEKRGIKVIFLNKDYTDERNGDFYYKLEGLIAEKEKKEILDRFRRGKKHKAKKGIVVGNMPPFGYNYVKKTEKREGYYKVNPGEAKAVREIFKMYLEIQSITALAKNLTESGIYTPRKKGENWRVSSIHKILKNESYIGTTYWGKGKSVEKENSNGYQRQVKSGRIQRPKDEWIPIKVPTILNRNTFELAQKLLKKNHKPYGKAKYPYLLSGLVECVCGANYGGEQSRGYSYYRCSDRKRRYLLPKKCKAKMVGTDLLDDTIWLAISEAITKPQVMFKFFGFVSEKFGRIEQFKKEIKDLESKLKKEQTKRDRLIEIYREGDITKEEYKAKISVSNRIKEGLEKEEKNKGEMLAQIENTPATKEKIREFCKIAKKEIKNLPFEKKRRLLRNILDRVIYNSFEKKASITGQIPVEISDFSSLFSGGILSPSY